MKPPIIYRFIIIDFDSFVIWLRDNVSIMNKKTRPLWTPKGRDMFFVIDIKLNHVTQ